MFDLVAFCDNLSNLWLPTDRAGDRFFNGAIVVILNLFVVGRLPMNEDYTDTPIRKKSAPPHPREAYLERPWYRAKASRAHPMAMSNKPPST